MVIFSRKNMINSQVEFGHFDRNKLNALKKGWKLNIFTLAGDHLVLTSHVIDVCNVDTSSLSSRDAFFIKPWELEEATYLCLAAE